MWPFIAIALANPPLEHSPLASCTAVPRVTTGEAALLGAGVCEWERGELAAAAATLSRVTDPDLMPYARLYEARAHLDNHQPAQAFDRLADVALSGRAGLELRLARGRAQVALHRSLEAREDLRALLRTEVGVPARYWLAVGGDDRGERDAAIATFRAVWTTAVRGPWADDAAGALQRLGAPVPDATTAAGKALIRARAEALQEDKQPEAALALLELLDAGPAPAPGRGLALARARFATRDYAGTIEAYESTLGEVEAATGSPRDLFDYALAYARSGDYETASELYERVMAQHPTSEQADLASFKRGYMAYDERDCDSARPLFREHLRDRPRSAHADEALWFASRCAFLQADPSDARLLLARLLRDHPRSDLVPGAHYWTARADGLAGDAEAERAGLQSVLRSYPNSGYAWFAADRLGTRFTGHTPAPLPAMGAAVAALPDMRAARKLLDAGLDDFAAERLAAFGTGSDRTTRLGVAAMLLDAGRIREARDMVSPWCGDLRDAPDLEALPMCLPRPEHRFVQVVAASAGQDPALSYGIMTAESALQPVITSAAGARGLMQVMPAEGPRMHRQAFGAHGSFDVDRLYEPSYNAALGASELASLSASLGDCLIGPDVPATIASYNGGEAAVRRWLDLTDEPIAADMWSEEIGYTETRKYVRRVLGFWMAYRWAYGDPVSAP